MPSERYRDSRGRFARRPSEAQAWAQAWEGVLVFDLAQPEEIPAPPVSAPPPDNAPTRLPVRARVWATVTGDTGRTHHAFRDGQRVYVYAPYTGRPGYYGEHQRPGCWVAMSADLTYGVESYWLHENDLAVIPPNPDCERGCVNEQGCWSCRPALFRRCLTGAIEDTLSYGSRPRCLNDSVPIGEHCSAHERRCNECDEGSNIHLRSSVFRTDDGSYVCGECHRRMYRRCNLCDATYRRDGEHRCPYMHFGCETCASSRYAGMRVIDSYSYAPDLNFLGEPSIPPGARGPLYFGVEMEMECGDERPETVARHILSRVNVRGQCDRVFAKSDGSLSQGVELVTHPMTFDYIMGLDPLWETFAEIREDFGMENSSNAGLHVHVSRDGFSGPRHSYRWIKFFHRNQRQICRIARRRNSSWAKWSQGQRDWAIHIAKYGQGASQVHPGGTWYAAGKSPEAFSTYGEDSWRCDDRYRAINNTNSETFEVRVFAGSVHADEIRAGIQLVHASIEYTRKATVQELIKSRYGWDAFREYLTDNSEIYADLISADMRL